MKSFLANRLFSLMTAAAVFCFNGLSAEVQDNSLFQKLRLIEKKSEDSRECSNCNPCMRGPRGYRGHHGKKGDKGDRGHRGHQGHRGRTGPQGPQGPAGESSIFNTYLYAYDTTRWQGVPDTVPNVANSVPFTQIPANSQSGITFDGTTVTIQTTGLYLIAVEISNFTTVDDVPPATYLALGINGLPPVNGGPYNTTYVGPSGVSSPNTPFGGTFLVPLNAGDTVVVQLYDLSGSGADTAIITASPLENANAANRTLSVIRVN